MINIHQYIPRFTTLFPLLPSSVWELPSLADNVIAERIKNLTGDYVQMGSAFVHRTATVEQHVIMKGPIIIGPGCFVGAHAYLRGGVFLDESVVIGPGCEVKSSILFRRSALAHFNFAGDSIIGEEVNMEAGSILANHFNERQDKTIRAVVDESIVTLPVTKFGSLLGDGTKIGANAVLSPGTVLMPGSVVKRLQLVEQSNQ